MNIIIDTHVFLWLLNDPSRIKPEQMEYLENTDNRIFLSTISIAELEIKKSIGKLNFNFNSLEMSAEMGIEILNFTGLDALKLGSIPFHHKDPFDRMIISQGLANKFTILSYDSKFSLYDCKLI